MKYQNGIKIEVINAYLLVFAGIHTMILFNGRHETYFLMDVMKRLEIYDRPHEY